MARNNVVLVNRRASVGAVAAQRSCSPLVCVLGSPGMPLDLGLVYSKTRTGEV